MSFFFFSFLLSARNFRLLLSLVICGLETQFSKKMLVKIFEKGVRSSFPTFKNLSPFGLVESRLLPGHPLGRLPSHL